MIVSAAAAGVNTIGFPNTDSRTGAGGLVATARPTTKADIDRSATRPPVPPVLFHNVPELLKDYPHWVAWRRDWKAGAAGKPGKWDKVLYRFYEAGNPRRTFCERAKSTDPKTWADYESLASRLELSQELFGGGGWGLGFCPHDDDPLVFFDFDGVLDKATRQFLPGTERIQAAVRRLDTYTEVTPSGVGLRCWSSGSKPPGSRCRAKLNGFGVEVYDRAHFSTVTGDHFPGTPLTVNDRQAEADAVRAELLPEPIRPAPHPAPARSATSACGHAYGDFRRPADLSDAELIDKALASPEFYALWHGDRCGKNPSEADWQLAKSLAFWTNRDAARVARLFRQSGLYRPPPEKSQGYPEWTAKNACDRQTKGYGDGSYRSYADDLDAELACLRAAGVAPCPAPPVYTPLLRDAAPAASRPTGHSPGASAQRPAAGQETACPTACPAASTCDPLAGLERFTVDAGQPGHPDYWREEREAVATAAAEDAARRYGDFADDADLMALLDSFMPAGESPECRRARVVLQELGDSHSKRSIGNPCLSPSCPLCRPVVSRQTFRRFLHHVGRLPDAPVYVSHVFSGDWRRLRMWEKAGQYGRVVEQFYGAGENAEARYLVLSTRPLPDSTPMGRKEALLVVAAAIRKYPGEAHDFVKHHPFAFCKGWGAIEEEIGADDDTGHPRKYELDRKTTAASRKSGLSVDGLLSILRHYDVAATEDSFCYKGRKRLYVDFRMPDDGETRAKIALAIERGSAEEADEIFAALQAVEEARLDAAVEANQRDFEAAVFGHP